MGVSPVCLNKSGTNRLKYFCLGKEHRSARRVPVGYGNILRQESVSLEPFASVLYNMEQLMAGGGYSRQTSLRTVSADAGVF
jgi:hypothetical protein